MFLAITKKTIALSIFIIMMCSAHAEVVSCNKIPINSIDENGPYLNMRSSAPKNGKLGSIRGVIPNFWEITEEFSEEWDRDRAGTNPVGHKIISGLDIRMIGWDPSSHWIKVKTEYIAHTVYKSKLTGVKKWRKTNHQFKGWVSGKKLGWKYYTFLFNDQTTIYSGPSKDSALIKKGNPDAIGSYTGLYKVYGCSGNMILVNQSLAEQSAKYKGWVDYKETIGDAQY